jgi:hypothetical protein
MISWILKMLREFFDFIAVLIALVPLPISRYLAFLSKVRLGLIALVGFAALGWSLLIVNFLCRDFPNMLMDECNSIFYEIRRRLPRAGPQDVNVRKVIVLHYISPSYQVGFRAYKGLAPIKPRQEGRLPLYVRTSFSGSQKTVEYFTWPTKSSTPAAGIPKFGIRESNSRHSPPTITITDDEPQNLAIFKNYGDAHQPDFFMINPISIESKEGLHHYVIVKNSDLENWNPNKFIFNLKERKIFRGSIIFSNAVYITLSDDDRRLIGARQLLQRFSQLQPPNRHPSENEHFDLAKNYVKDIFAGNNFQTKVTVFFRRMNAEETNLFLAYYFPGVQQAECPPVGRFLRRVREVIKI